MHRGFWWEKLGERENLKYLGVDGRITLKDLQKGGWGTWTGLIWLGIVTSGGFY
jgi:hypothetical protein